MSSVISLHDLVQQAREPDLDLILAGVVDAPPPVLPAPGERLPSFPAIWLGDAQMPEHSQAIIKNLIDPGSFGLIVGPSGSGKTFLAQDMMLHVACGMPWRGRSVLRSLVVYVAAEAGVAILKRFIAWREKNLGEAADAVPLAILTRGPDMLNGVDVAVLIRQLKELSAEAGMPVGVVVFDTLSRSIPGGDENASADMTCVISVADQIRDELGAATGFVHHVGKDPTRGARGHSSLYAAADWVLAVDRGVATVEKQRDGIAGEQFPFRLEVVEMGTDPDGDPITTCVVVHQDAAHAQTSDRPTALSGAAVTGLKALHEAVGEYGQIMGGSSTIPAGVRAVKLDEWRTRFRLRYGTDGEGKRAQDAIRQAFGRAREQLLKAGKVGISDPYCWSTGR
ncbi:MAG: AAA family ATPase [Burkholderiales bacterium]